MGAPTPLVLLPLWCSYPLGCSYPLVLLRWVLLPLGCSYPIGCSYPLRFVFVLVDVSLLMGGLTPPRRGCLAPPSLTSSRRARLCPRSLANPRMELPLEIVVAIAAVVLAAAVTTVRGRRQGSFEQCQWRSLRDLQLD